MCGCDCNSRLQLRLRPRPTWPHLRLPACRAGASMVGRRPCRAAPLTSSATRTRRREYRRGEQPNSVFHAEPWRKDHVFGGEATAPATCSPIRPPCSDRYRRGQATRPGTASLQLRGLRMPSSSPRALSHCLRSTRPATGLAPAACGSKAGRRMANWQWQTQSIAAGMHAPQLPSISLTDRISFRTSKEGIRVHEASASTGKLKNQATWGGRYLKHRPPLRFLVFSFLPPWIMSQSETSRHGPAIHYASARIFAGFLGPRVCRRKRRI